MTCYDFASIRGTGFPPTPTTVMETVTVVTTLASMATIGITAYLGSAGYDAHDPNMGVIASLRFAAAGSGLVGEGGVDILWLPKRGAEGLFFFAEGEIGLAPTVSSKATFTPSCQWSLQNRPVVVTSKPATLRVDWS